MKRIITSLSIVTIFATSSFAKADKSLVEEYMEVSGATQTIESLSTQVVNGIEQTSAIYGKKPDLKRIKILQKLFAPDESVSSVEDSLIKQFDNKTLKKIISFYHSRVGQELIDANLEALDPSTQSKMLRFLADLRENPPSKTRAKIVNNYIDALESSKLLEDLFFEMFDYLNQKAPKSKKIPHKKREQFMKMLGSSFEQQMFISTMFLYRDISDEDIKKATQYLNSQAGKKEKKIVREAIRKMIKDGLKRAL